MPGGVDASVDQRGGEDGVGAAPGPAIEETGDGGEEDVAPVGKTEVGDVREAEEDRSSPPAGDIACAGPREHILEQPPEEKFFRPGVEEKDGDGEKREREPRVPLRRKVEEVHAAAERDGDGAEDEEAGEYEKTPAAAPADVVADAGNFADKDEGGESDIEAEQHGENVGEACVGIRPEPVRG